MAADFAFGKAALYYTSGSGIGAVLHVICVRVAWWEKGHGDQAPPRICSVVQNLGELFVTGISGRAATAALFEQAFGAHCTETWSSVLAVEDEGGPADRSPAGTACLAP